MTVMPIMAHKAEAIINLRASFCSSRACTSCSVPLATNSIDLATCIIGAIAVVVRKGGCHRRHRQGMEVCSLPPLR